MNKVGRDAGYAVTLIGEYCRERNTDIVREARTSVIYEERERHHTQRVGQWWGQRGRIIWDTEGTLWFEMHQGEDKVDRDPVHILRYPHGECSLACLEDGDGIVQAA